MMTTTPTEAATLPVGKAARFLGVHPHTLRAWADRGRLPYLRLNARGDRRFRVDDLRLFQAASSRPTTASTDVQRMAPSGRHDRLGSPDRFHRQAGHAPESPEHGGRDRGGHLRRAAASSSTTTTCACTASAVRTSCRWRGMARSVRTRTRPCSSSRSVWARASPDGWRCTASRHTCLTRRMTCGR